jgi:hypothetical protein
VRRHNGTSCEYSARRFGRLDRFGKLGVRKLRIGKRVGKFLGRKFEWIGFLKRVQRQLGWIEFGWVGQLRRVGFRWFVERVRRQFGWIERQQRVQWFGQRFGRTGSVWILRFWNQCGCAE